MKTKTNGLTVHGLDGWTVTRKPRGTWEVETATGDSDIYIGGPVLDQILTAVDNATPQDDGTATNAELREALQAIVDEFDCYISDVFENVIAEAREILNQKTCRSCKFYSLVSDSGDTCEWALSAELPASASPCSEIWLKDTSIATDCPCYEQKI